MKLEVLYIAKRTSESVGSRYYTCGERCYPLLWATWPDIWLPRPCEKRAPRPLRGPPIRIFISGLVYSLYLNGAHLSFPEFAHYARGVPVTVPRVSRPCFRRLSQAIHRLNQIYCQVLFRSVLPSSQVCRRWFERAAEVGITRCGGIQSLLMTDQVKQPAPRSKSSSKQLMLPSAKEEQTFVIAAIGTKYCNGGRK